MTQLEDAKRELFALAAARLTSKKRRGFSE
jgi:hypothetical protein